MPKGKGEVKDQYGLYPPWREVCEHWLADPERNQTRAWGKVYDPKGEKQKSTLAPHASRFFRRKEVQKYLQLRIEQMMTKFHVTQENIIREWGFICFSDPRRLFDENGELKLPQDWDDEVAASISSIKVSTGRDPHGKIEHLKELRFWDKNKALGDAGRHLNMFKLDQEAAAPKVVPDRLNAAQKKAEEKRAQLKLVDES